jgi:catechol 2,3-dioxygenase-like lactoylglutathione lyase family enzyme
MKKLVIIIAVVSVYTTAYCQSKKSTTMKLNAGIVTPKMAESKTFYTSILGFSITFENEFYVLLQAPGKGGEISFLLPDHPSQQPLFHRTFAGQGVYLTIEVDNLDEIYEKIKEKNVPIHIEPRDEPWGERHFAITDPNGVAIDIVTYSATN